MKTILVPTDFTESTTHALNWVRLFARHYDATVVLLHVQAVTMPEGAVPVAGGLGLGMAVPVGTESVSHDQLDQLAAELRAGGIACQTDLRRGAVTDAILSAAQDHSADLIITGHKHMASFFGRLGSSMAAGVARAAHCPVLVVPTGDSESAPIQLKTIVFTTSLEFDQDEEFGQVVELGRRFEATIRVLHVRAENQPNLSDDMEMLGQLQEVYGTDLLLSDTVESRTVSGGIETYLTTNHPDLLVMTTRERDFLSGLLNPSLTGRMLTLANLPILVYHTQTDV